VLSVIGAIKQPWSQFAPKYLQDCLRAKARVALVPDRHLVFAGSSTQRLLPTLVDRFGDSFTEDLTETRFLELFRGASAPPVDSADSVATKLLAVSREVRPLVGSSVWVDMHTPHSLETVAATLLAGATLSQQQEGAIRVSDSSEGSMSSSEILSIAQSIKLPPP
jgi:hypothetical protein